MRERERERERNQTLSKEYFNVWTSDFTSIVVCPWVLCCQLKERYFRVEPPGVMVDLH